MAASEYGIKYYNQWEKQGQTYHLCQGALWDQLIDFTDESVV